MNLKSTFLNLKPIFFLGIFLAVAFWLFAGPDVESADALTCNAATSTSILSWNNSANWSCGRVPTSADDVVLIAGDDGGDDRTRLTADVTSTVNSITINVSAATSTITFGTNITLTVNGNVTINGATSNGVPKKIVVGASTNHLNIGGTLILAGGNINRPAEVTATTGTVTVGNGITFSTGSAELITTTGAATINVTGTIGSGGTFSLNSATTVNFSGTSTINNGYTYPIVNVNSGTLTIGGSPIFGGAVTVVSGASWANTGNNTVEFRGGLTNSSGGTISMGTGTHTFSTNAQALGGADSITFGGAVSITNGTVVTNNNTGTVTISGDLTGATGASQWTQGANSTLTATGAVLATGTLDVSTNTPNTVNYSGTDQTIKSPSSSYYNLTISGSNNTSPTITVTNTLTITNTFTPSSGTITLSGSGTVFNNSGGTFTASGTQIVSVTNGGTVTLATDNDNVTFFDLTLSGGGTVQFTAGRTYSTTGLFTISNATNINSTTGSSQWFITHTGTESINAGTINYSGCSSSQDITITTGTEGTSVDACWVFAGSTIDISGTCKLVNQSDNCTDAGANHLIRVAVNGTLQAETQGTVGATWTISGVAEPGAGQIVTVFIDGESASSSQAVAVTQWDAGNITGVELIEAHLTIGSDQRNEITNAELGDYDSSVSANMTFHDVNAGVLTVDVDHRVDNEELYIKGGNTYRPDSAGGDTINTHDVEINGTFQLDTNVVAASGSWDNNGYFLANTGSVSFTGIGSETISNVASASGWRNDFYHLKIDSPNNGGTLTFGGDGYDYIASGQIKIETGDTLSVASGKKLTQTGSTLFLNGTISGAGRFVYRSATAFPTSGTVSSILVFDAKDGNQTMSQRTYTGAVEITNNSTSVLRTVTMGAGSPYTFSGNLHIVASTSQNVRLVGATNDPAVVDVAGDLDFTGTGAGAELITSGTGDWQINGNANFTDGTFTTESGNTLTMDGTGTLTSNGQTLQNLVINSGGTVTLAGATHTVNGDLTLGGAGTPVVTGSTITMAGTSNTITGGSKTLNNLTIDGSSAVVSLSTSDLTVGGTLTVGADDTFKIDSGRTLTLSNTGTPLSISGTFEADDGSTVAYSGSTATVTATTFGNLTLGDGADAITLPSGDTTIKGTLTVASTATVASGSGKLLFRKGTTQTINDNNNGTSNLGSIAVRASSSGDPTTLTLSSDIKISSVSIDASQTLDASGSNTLVLQGSDSGGSSPFIINGTFTSSTGTVQYTGGSVNVVAPSSVYNNLTLGGVGAYTLPASDLTLRGNLVVADGATVASSSNNDIVFAIGGGSSQSVTDSNSGSKQNLGEIQVSANSGNTTLTLGSDIRIASATIDSSQTLDTNGANNIVITGDDDVFTNNGIFAPRTGTVQYTGTTTNIGASKYGDLTLGGSGTYTLPSAGTTTILGTLTNSSTSTITSGSATIFFANNGNVTITDNNSTKQNFGEISVIASTGGNTTLLLGSDVRIASTTINASQTLNANGSNTLTITNGTSEGSANVLTASGSFGTFTPSTGTVVFTGDSSTNIPTLDYFRLNLQTGANSVTHTFDSGMASVSDTFTIASGGYTGFTVTALNNDTGIEIASVSIGGTTTLVADDTQEFSVGGNFINNGTFTHSGGTVTFEQPGTASISGESETTFNNFTVTTPDKKLKFQAKKITTIAGTMTVTGASGQEIELESTASGSQWLVHFNSAQGSITYARVADAGCTSTSEAATLDSTSINGGRNGTCWFTTGAQVDKIGPGTGVSIGGASGGGTQQPGGGQGGGSGGSDDGESGGGSQQGGGGSGGGGGGSPIIFDWWWIVY